MKEIPNSSEKYKLLFEYSSIGMALVNFKSTNFLEVNQRLLDSTNYTKKELLNLTYLEIFPLNCKNEILKILESLKKEKNFAPITKELIKKNGEVFPIKISGFLFSDENAEDLVCLQIEDITKIKQHKMIYKDNKQLLEYIAIENNLKKVLKKIVDLAELRNPNTMCSILVLDTEKKHLFKACAPNLPEFYNEAINGIEIGEKVGSCGSAAYKKERVIVENINTHENWQPYLNLTKKANLHSCWSEPIFSSNDEILGTFAIYTNKIKKPTGYEIKLIETYSNLASIAIEKDAYTRANKKKEEELEQLFNNTQVGLMYISGDRIILKVNQRLAQTFGYNNPEEMLGMSTKKLHFTEKRYKEFGKENFYTLKEQDKSNIEYQLKKKDGTPIWCELSGKALDTNIPADLSKGVMWTVNDISLRKKFKSELIKSELLNKNILSTIPDLVWLKDKDGLYLACNPEFEFCFGIKEKEILGKDDYSFIDKKSADYFRLHDKIAMNAQKTVVNEEWVFHNKLNKEILIETSKKVMKDNNNNILGVLGIGHDITKRKQREEELKELNIKAEKLTNSQQVLLSLFDKGDSVLFNWKNDEKWRIEYVSLSVTKLFGYTKDDFLSGNILFSSCIHKDDLESVVYEVTKAKKNNLDYFKHTPYRILTKDREEKWILGHTVTQKNSKGEITNFIGYIIDITEQIKNQELVYHQSKIASMGEMLGNISHQWRQPLSVISTLATGTKLKKELDILEINELYEYMDLINKNAQYLSRTIDDFRNFFTSKTGLSKEINLKESIEKVFSLIKDSFKSSNIKTIFNTNDIYLISNENIFIQALLNIFNNARDALTENNIQEKYVFIDLFKDKNDYILTIRDNAGGIPKKIIDKIFEPYFTTKHKSQGTGIGLYMTNQIITKHLKGQISVENVTFSYKNKKYIGACFEIRIPI
ncbi:MAG: hypothetical protein C0625_11055 [Arcobacter sp.]|nr:MAG: hypothetical protein C0625_11055 [Arcobacter sp.]